VKELLKPGSTLILIGAGGVGKTTVAASIGMAAAMTQLDTVVITVDPARRLRDALGIERLSVRPTRIDGRRLRAAGLDQKLRLSAMVLDVKRTWDGLVERFVKDPGARRTIMENSFYRNLTEQFAGAEAYAALEQLYDLHSSGRFDLEVVDTPPATHAFEFIQAPAHLVRLLDSPAARWLFLPYAAASQGVAGLAGRAARFVVNQLESFTGLETLKSISEFFSAAAEATGAVSQRFHTTEMLLRSPNLHFVLVTTPREDRLKEARAVMKQMDEAGLKLRAIVLNRTLDATTFDAFATAPRRLPRHLEEIGLMRKSLAAESPEDRRLEPLIGYLEDYAANQQAMIEQAARFAREVPTRVKIAVVPEVEVGVRDLGALAKIASILVSGTSGRRFLENAAGTLARQTSARPTPVSRRATR
jgi:anion-transporting  ArsA/GET3 family ATPase